MKFLFWELLISKGRFCSWVVLIEHNLMMAEKEIIISHQSSFFQFLFISFHSHAIKAQLSSTPFHFIVVVVIILNELAKILFIEMPHPSIHLSFDLDLGWLATIVSRKLARSLASLIELS